MRERAPLRGRPAVHRRARDACEDCGGPVQRVLHAVPSTTRARASTRPTTAGQGRERGQGRLESAASESGSKDECGSVLGQRLRVGLVVRVQGLRLQELRLEERVRRRLLVEEERRLQAGRLTRLDGLGAAGGERVAGRGGERGRLAQHREDDAAVLVAADQLARASHRRDGPPRRQCSVLLERSFRQPSSIRSLAERSVVSGLPSASPTRGRWNSVLGRGEAVRERRSTRCWRSPRVTSLSHGLAVFSRTRAYARACLPSRCDGPSEAPGVAVEAVRDDLLGLSIVTPPSESIRSLKPAKSTSTTWLTGYARSARSQSGSPASGRPARRPR